MGPNIYLELRIESVVASFVELWIEDRHQSMAAPTEATTFSVYTFFTVYTVCTLPQSSPTIVVASDGEIHGLQASRNGRSCLQHTFCGMAVVPNDIIRFKTTVIDRLNQSFGIPEEVIKAVLICYLTELCTVGFLSKAIAVTERMKQRFVGQFAQVIELYDLSTKKTLAFKS